MSKLESTFFESRSTNNIRRYGFQIGAVIPSMAGSRRNWPKRPVPAPTPQPVLAPTTQTQEMVAMLVAMLVGPQIRVYPFRELCQLL